MTPSAWFLIALVAGGPFAIAWHELGHALVGLVLGMRLREYSLGAAGKGVEFTVLGVKVHLSPRITQGHVVVDLPTGRAATLRYAAMIAAGPAANVLMAAIVFLTLPRDIAGYMADAPTAAMWVGWGCCNILIVSYASSQADVGPAAATPSSDRTKLSMLRRAPREFMALWRLLNRLAELLRDQRKAAPAAGRCHGIALQSVTLPAEQAEAMEALLQHPRVRYSERLALIDQHCTQVLFWGNAAYFPRALEWSGRLFAGRGREPTVQGTHGSILALAGRWDEAAAMLRGVVEKSTAATDKTISAAVLAWIAHRRGDAAEAARWWAVAEKENDGPFPIPWMAAEIGLTRPLPLEPA